MRFEEVATQELFPSYIRHKERSTEEKMSSGFIIAKQNQYMRRFQEAGAVSPETARSLEQVGCRDSRMFQRMVRRDVICQAAPGKYYLDVQAAQGFRKARRERALNVLPIVLVIAVVLIYFTMKR
jgi:hypothetical protein